MHIHARYRRISLVSSRAARTSEAVACIPRYTGSRRYTADRDATVVYDTWQRWSAGGEATALAGGDGEVGRVIIYRSCFLLFSFSYRRARARRRHSRSKSHRRPHVHDTVNNTHTLNVNKPANHARWSTMDVRLVAIILCHGKCRYNEPVGRRWNRWTRPANTVNTSRPLALRPVGI